MQKKTENNNIIQKGARQDLGVIICEGNTPNHLNFDFQIAEETEVKVGEYVEVPLGLSVLVGRVSSIQSYNEYYTDPEFVKYHIARGITVDSRFPTRSSRWRVAKVKVVGIVRNDRILPPEDAPEPGDTVYRADTRLLTRLLGLPSDGLYIGLMRGNNSIKVLLDPEKLVRHHVAILGATGSGKSYAVGVLIEELLEKNLPVLVIDPHGEYSTFRQPNKNPEEVERCPEFGVTPKGYRAITYFPKGLGKNGGGELTISMSDLDAYAISEICGMSDVQSDLLFLAVKRLSEERRSYDAEVLAEAVEEAAEEWKFQKNTILSTLRRITVLKELGIFGEGFSTREIVKPGVLSIIDLSEDMDERVRRIVAGVILQKVFQARKRDEVPPALIVVEESHRFAPQEANTYSKRQMRKIAREGRKFGLGLCITSQRIAGLDKDILSQCGTKIVFRIEGNYDLEYLKPYLDYSSTDDIGRIPLLPNGIAITSGVATQHPIITEIRVRRTHHGGTGTKLIQ
ncbi:MAG: ATP-binding protein [Candidatus Jordarchaeaceae archaeon]